MVNKTIRRKYIPCWVVIRESPAHVLAAFEDLEMAEVYASKCNAYYKEKQLPLKALVQPTDFCHF